MKKIKIILLFYIVISVGCKQKKLTPDYYKNLYTGEILNKTEYANFDKNLYLKYQDSSKTLYIGYELKKIIRSSDSVIQPFIYSVRVGNEYKVNPSKAKIFEYINKEFPIKKLLTITGDSIQIGGIQSKPTFINFWFIGCPPCIAEKPVLNKIKEKYSDRVNFISITFEKKKNVLKFLKKHKFNFKHVAGARKFIKELEIHGYPKNIFIDKAGNLIYVEGGIPFNEDKEIGNGLVFEKHIEELL